MKEYKIQRALLVNASIWFQKALTGKWEEGETLGLTFPDVDVNVIEQFLYFLVRGEVNLPPYDSHNEVLPVKLWIFADKYDLPTLQSQAMTRLYALYTPGCPNATYPSIQTIAEALSMSTQSSDLYRCMKAVLMTGLRSGIVETQGTNKQMGNYMSEDVMMLEQFPGVMTDILRETFLFGPKLFGAPTL